MSQRKRRRCSGMTLVEVMVSTGVMLISVMAVLFSYVKAMEMNVIGYGAGIAMHTVKDKMELIKSSNFSTLSATYNNTTFSVNGLTGRGVIYVNVLNAHLTQVKVVYCWRLDGGRIIGEDSNLNGVKDAGEDRNGNGQLDSYVQLVTQIYG